jgi:hypothetical protein
MSKEKLMAACVNIVAVSGRPISLIEDVGFQMIIDPLIKALEPNAAINSQNVRQEISKVAFERRVLISEAVIGKFLCLKFDCCTRLDLRLYMVRYGFSVFRTAPYHEPKTGCFSGTERIRTIVFQAVRVTVRKK